MSPVFRSTVRSSRYPPETKSGAGAVSFETKSPLQVIGMFAWCPAWCSCCFPSAWSSVPRGAERTMLPPKAKTETTAMASTVTARRIFVPILTSFHVVEDGELHEECMIMVGTAHLIVHQNCIKVKFCTFATRELRFSLKNQGF